MGLYNKRKLTIGLMVSGITDELTISVCRGVMQMAEKLDVNIVVFPGKYVNRDVSNNPDLTYEYQYNTIFSYAVPENMDALIISAGTIGCLTTEEYMRGFLEEFKDIPHILTFYSLDGYVNIQFDNYNGIREGLDYLIEKTGCRKIGMIGGSDDNTDAYERKKAFIETLERHGIPFEESAFAEGNLLRTSVDAYRELLDNNPDLDAVFCVNDDTAIGLYDELNRRGYEIGRDIHVLGYDDITLATKMDPALSSVRADGAEVGEAALKMVVRLLQGEKVESKVLPTHFIRRDSIGTGVRQEEIRRESVFDQETIDGYFNGIFYRCPLEKSREGKGSIKDSFRQLLTTLDLIYGRGEDVPENHMKIQSALDDFINGGAMVYADISNLLNCLEGICGVLEKSQDSRENRIRLQDTFLAVYRRLIRGTDVQMGRILEEQSQENYSMKMFIRDVLQFEKGNDLSYTSLLGNLDWMGMKHAYLYTFKKPVMHLAREHFTPPKFLYLKAVFQNGEVSAVPSLNQKTRLKDIFRKGFISEKERYSYVCMPLFSSEMLYGILLCDLTEEVFVNGEFLVNQMSSGAKMIALLKTNEEIQQELEDSLIVLKENNIVLDNLSKSDGLTGILNRRGFYLAAERLIEEKKGEGKGVLAIYVDMNNLKIINDRYGHEEGDFSIKLISDILSEEMKEAGVAGRIGGDEFACVVEYGAGESEDILLNRIYNRFTLFNEHSSKPYNITVSAGACYIGTEDTLTLKEALTQADEKLYEVKKFRKKDVAK
jgi:diguanylate cyclase (GGDEF)-like protein